MFALPSRALLRERWQAAQRRLQPPIGMATCHVHLPDEFRVAPEPWSVQVVARALCRYRFVPFDGLAGADRLGHLSVQLRAWAPFADAEYAVALGESGAMVYAWDREAFLARSRLGGVPTLPGRVLPEGFLLPHHAEGVHLHHCIAGVEARVFRRGELVATRGWPSTPDTSAWQNFLRSNGVADAGQHAAQPTEDASANWLDAPWGNPALFRDLLDRPRVRLHQAVAIAALLLLLPTVWLSKSLVSAGSRIDDLAAERRALENTAGPLMGAREEALAGLASLEALHAAVDRPNPVALLATLSRQLPDDGTLLRELEWDDRTLRLVLAPGPSASRTTLVKALEAGGWLTGVHELSAEQGPEAGSLVLVAELAAETP